MCVLSPKEAKASTAIVAGVVIFVGAFASNSAYFNTTYKVV
jgi:hypothetical protein